MFEIEAKRGYSEEPARWSEEGPTAPGVSPGLRVLLAEDDVHMRELLVEVLNDAGYHVTVANNGIEMLSNLSEAAVCPFPGEAFDLVITDQLMPGCTGLDALARVRKMGYAVPAVLITASPDQDLRQRANGLHAKVLTKPFGVTELHDAVDQVTLLEVCAV
jgi:CheY-like chemotaxis protein